ncbi:MAG: hypothetical protein GKC53_01850 [Neisseriaceae bacterium]|nr:MAG: hypothetical protein GKC53_01850 [Neisseriaceae bacterium]
MKDFGKKILSMIIGMVIATFLIVILLWFINRSVLEHDFSAKKKDPNIPIATINISKDKQQPETLHPADFNNGISSSDLTNSQIFSQNNNFDPTSHIEYNSDTKHYPDFDFSEVQNNDSNNINSKTSNKNNIEIQDKNINVNKPAKKIIPPAKEPNNEDTIGNLINNINSRKISQRTEQKTGTGKKYKVQIGSYKTPQEASKQKARLIMMDINSTVVKVNINGQDYYRVMTIQPVSKEQAYQIKSTLKNKNIDSLIISQ